MEENFNSRPHEEVDVLWLVRVSESLSISTHDLTKRSTALRVISQPSLSAFQLTTSRRGRPIFTQQPRGTLIFQLTTSRRGRPHSPCIATLPKGYFNSRPHEEVDLYRGAGRHCIIYFNSRPHEEVDSNFYAKSFPFQITFCAYCI